MRTGDRAHVRFRFMYHPEYLKVGLRLVIREGQCKGIGILSNVRLRHRKILVNTQVTPVDRDGNPKLSKEDSS